MPLSQRIKKKPARRLMAQPAPALAASPVSFSFGDFFFLVTTKLRVTNTLSQGEQRRGSGSNWGEARVTPHQPKEKEGC